MEDAHQNNGEEVLTLSELIKGNQTLGSNVMNSILVGLREDATMKLEELGVEFSTADIPTAELNTESILDSLNDILDRQIQQVADLEEKYDEYEVDEPGVELNDYQKEKRDAGNKRLSARIQSDLEMLALNMKIMMEGVNSESFRALITQPVASSDSASSECLEKIEEMKGFISDSLHPFNKVRQDIDDQQKNANGKKYQKAKELFVEFHKFLDDLALLLRQGQ